MEFNHLLPIILALLCPLVLVEGSHASETPLAVLYWQSVLPNVPLPQTLQQLAFNSAGNKGNFLNGHQQAEVFSFFLSKAAKIYPSANFNWGGGKNETTNYTNTTLFFLNTDLRSGKTFNVRFSDNIIDKIGFLPRQVSDSIPFSTKKLPEIFNHFSINPKSIEAHYMKTTLEDCEAPELKGEDKYCATSLESFVDFGVARFGKKVLVLSNEVEEEKNKVQKYKVLKGIKMVGREQIVCHKEIYPYTVFYCHKFKASEAYKVTLLGTDGKKAKALVMCHTDTSAWNPNHMAFKLLNVKPGGATICHFLYSDTMVWVRN